MISPCDFFQNFWLLDRSPTFHIDCSSGCLPKQQAMATSIMKQCKFCHGVGHNDRTCAKKREWVAKKQQKDKAAKDVEDTSSVASLSTTVTIPSPESTPKPPVKLVQPVKPSSIALSESEEREARKIEKKLREIEALEKRLQQGRPCTRGYYVNFKIKMLHDVTSLHPRDIPRERFVLWIFLYVLKPHGSHCPTNHESLD